MIKRQVTKSEALSLINKGVVVKNDTSDGFVAIRKKPKGIYEIRIYTHGVEKPDIANGSFSALMKTFNKFDDYYVEEQ